MILSVPLGGDSDPQSARGRIAGRPEVAGPPASGLAADLSSAEVVVVLPAG